MKDINKPNYIMGLTLVPNSEFKIFSCEEKASEARSFIDAFLFHNNNPVTTICYNELNNVYYIRASRLGAIEKIKENIEKYCIKHNIDIDANMKISNVATRNEMFKSDELSSN